MKNVIRFLIFALLLGCNSKKEEVRSAQTFEDSINTEPVEANRNDSFPKNQKESDSSFVKVFKFDSELCSHKGYYDSRKYTEQEIKATYDLYWNSAKHSLSGNSPMVFKLKDLEKIVENNSTALQKLNKDFEQKSQQF